MFGLAFDSLNSLGDLLTSLGYCLSFAWVCVACFFSYLCAFVELVCLFFIVRDVYASAKGSGFQDVLVNILLLAIV